MSDEVFEIATSFGDVAELGQGYINRADGERILIPLAHECEVGDGVRFIVHLVDGTPAFAGAGRCVQSSDQGAAAGAERYETLLDSLAFDDRSRPVYEYIVAVRQAVYAAGGPEAQAQEAVAVEAEAVAVAEAEAGEPGMDEPTTYEASYEATADSSPDVADEPREAEAEAEAEPASEDAFELAAAPEHEEHGELADYDSAHLAEPVPDSIAPVRMASVRPASLPPIAYVEDETPVPALDPAAFVIAPISRGMLQRAAVVAHWQPAPPEAPHPSKKSGLFRYAPGNLPVPSRPPRPELDPALRVAPAPAPTPSMNPARA